MTWASRSLGQTFSQTGSYLRRRLWIWPIVAIGLLTAVGYAVHRSVAATMRGALQSELQTLLDVETAMLRTWLGQQESAASSSANTLEVRRLISQLMANRTGEPFDVGDDPTADDPAAVPEPIDSSPLNVQIARRLAPAMDSHAFTGWAVLDRQGIFVAASEEDLVNQPTPDAMHLAIDQAIEGHAKVTMPFPSIGAISDHAGKIRPDVPTMFSIAPVRDEDFRTIALLAFRIRPEREFTRILQLGRIGQSGETYAFDEDSRMLSGSRFDDELILLGLLADRDGIESQLNVLVRDPGGNMTEGYRPSVRRGDLPPTRMVAAAIATGSGIDVDGYRDYRGVPVVGAWTWLTDYGFGVATEADVAEAYRPLVILQRTFWVLMTLLVLTSLAILAFSLLITRLQRQAQAAAIEAKQLGQYKLDEKIGEGGMGVVYKGRHAMLRRPTAIKLLSSSNITERSIAQFEREVQITARLNHPNTIAIYDFGRTPEDIFYYAMEFLDGIDCQTLVDTHGPLPPGRVVHLLTQVCGSLYEAHLSGLVHRDIKPANVMLNRRGAQSDVVKVLDFGLVKASADAGGHLDDHDSGRLAGTPLYLSPEAITTPGAVDATSDLYAVGAMGYFLITGQPPFVADRLSDLCQMHLTAVPPPPSSLPGVDCPADLESALLRCLEKPPSRRPASARELGDLLTACDVPEWSRQAADRWWDRLQRGLSPAVPPGSNGTPKSGSPRPGTPASKSSQLDATMG